MAKCQSTMFGGPGGEGGGAVAKFGASPFASYSYLPTRSKVSSA